MRKYRLVSKKGEGTFSEVLKAQNVKRGTYHAIKCMRNHFESIDQVNTLREIQALRRLSPHPHIITLEEVLYDQPTGRLALVFELMDQNLYEVIRGRRHYLSPQLIKIYIFQLLKGLEHMHRKGIFHRDIKPENILVNHNCDFEKGLKLADFGSCRGIYSKQPYTEYISTRWYRAPECLLTDGYYGAEMDLWGVGCVFFEITSLYPLFPGTNELDQINRIHQILGTPPEKVMRKFKEKGAAHLDFNYPSLKATGIAKLIPHAPSDAVDVMQRLLAYDPDDRISAKEALRHTWFADLVKMEQNLKRRNRGVSSRNIINSSPSPAPDRSERRKKKEKTSSSSSKMKNNRSSDAIGMEKRRKDRSKEPPKQKNYKASGSEQPATEDDPSMNKTTGSLPSISDSGTGKFSTKVNGNGSGGNASMTSRTEGGATNGGGGVGGANGAGRTGDSPLPPIAGDGGSTTKSNKVNSSYSSSTLSKSSMGSSSYGHSSYRNSKHRSSRNNPYQSTSKHRSSKHRSKERRSHGSKKSYGAYGSSIYKTSGSGTSRSHGVSKYGSGASGSSSSFSVMGHGQKNMKSGRRGYGNSRRRKY